MPKKNPAGNSHIPLQSAIKTEGVQARMKIELNYSLKILLFAQKE